MLRLLSPYSAKMAAVSARHMATKVSVANVKELRKLTALPMKLCREALQQGNDDVQTAMAWLDNNEEARAQRAQGNLAGRATAEGRIEVSVQGHAAALLQINCETDFVARNAEFAQLMEHGSQLLAGHMQNMPSSNGLVELTAEELEALVSADTTLGAITKSTMATLGENVKLARGAGFHQEGAAFGSYIHAPNGAFGALVLASGASGADASELLNNIAQHVVAMDPTASTPAATVQALLETPYLFDSSMTIQQLMEKSAPAGMSIENVVRWER